MEKIRKINKRTAMFIPDSRVGKNLLFKSVLAHCDALRLFKTLCLFFMTNYPGPASIPCPTSFQDSFHGEKA